MSPLNIDNLGSCPIERPHLATVLPHRPRTLDRPRLRRRRWIPAFELRLQFCLDFLGAKLLRNPLHDFDRVVESELKLLLTDHDLCREIATLNELDRKST